MTDVLPDLLSTDDGIAVRDEADAGESGADAEVVGEDDEMWVKRVVRALPPFWWIHSGSEKR